MKQGQATHSSMGSTKVEPKAHEVCPEYAADLGLARAYTKVPMYEGRGLEAPMAGTTVHHTGSQGKHK